MNLKNIPIITMIMLSVSLCGCLEKHNENNEHLWYTVVYYGNNTRLVAYHLEYIHLDDTCCNNTYAYHDSYYNLVYPDIQINGSGDYSIYVTEQNINGTWVAI